MKKPEKEMRQAVELYEAALSLLAKAGVYSDEAVTAAAEWLENQQPETRDPSQADSIGLLAQALRMSAK